MFPVYPYLSWLKRRWKEGAEKKRWRDFRIQRMDFKERIDNFILVIGMYSNDSCDPVAN